MPKLPEQEILDQLAADLAVDRYLTSEQCFRRYGLSDYSIKTMRRAGLVRTTPALLPPAYRSYAPIDVTLVSAPHSRTHPSSVRGVPHFLGLAEARWLLRDRIRNWHADVQDTQKVHHIDVVAYDDEGELLIEYDTGVYRPRVVLAKADVARSLGRRQLWATPSQTKAAKLCRLVPDGEIWVVRWEDGHAEMFQPAVDSRTLSQSGPDHTASSSGPASSRISNDGLPTFGQ